jgi:hypothetical protein
MEAEELRKLKTLDLQVFPSEEKTITVVDDDTYGGAHKYVINNCLGFNNGKTDYDFKPESAGQVIQFVRKDDNGDITPGLQSEQLALVLLDRCRKLNARFPSEHNEKQIRGLEMFLEGCSDRVKERIERGVMGELKK